MLRDQGRDLHAEFLNLLPARPRPIRIQRWSARRIGLLLLMVPLLLLLVLSVRLVLVNNDRTLTPLNVAGLGCGDLEPLWLEAQSVPSASLVPCVRSRATRLEIRRRERQERLVEVHAQRRGQPPRSWSCG